MCFKLIYVLLFITVASNQHALTSRVIQYFFGNVSPVLMMFWHNFGQEGGEGAMVTMFPRGAWYLVALSLLHLIK